MSVAGAPTIGRSPSGESTSAAEGIDHPRRVAGADADVEEFRVRLATDVFLYPRIEGHLLRRLGIDTSSGRAAALAGIAGAAIRLFIPLVVTALLGQWAGAPWERWALIAVLLGVGDAWALHRHAAPDVPLPSIATGRGRMLQEFTAMVPTIIRTADVRDLTEFTRRWYRLPVSALVAAGVAVAILLGCVLVAPAAVLALSVGSIAMLALLLYDFGELVFQNLYSVLLMRRESRYEHDLLWPSPVDSVEVQAELRVWATMQFAIGIGVTMSLVLALILVGLDSPLVVPLAAAFVLSGYATTLVSMVGVRGSVRRIVSRIRDRNLAVLQRRIEAYGSRFDDLTLQESQQVEHLIALHRVIRDADTSPATSQTLLRTAVALVIPTVMFIVTVFGEVMAERFLEQMLP